MLLGFSSFAGQPFSSPDAENDVHIVVTGNQLAISVGTAIATTNADAQPSGSQVSLGAGTVTVTGTALVQPSGSQVTLGIGNSTINIDVTAAVTGNALTLATGSVTVTGTAVVSPTGSQLTANTGEPNVITWNDIVPGVNMTWTEVKPY